MSKNKIAFAINAIGDGGAERVTTILCTRFAEKGYDVHLICNQKREWEYPVCNFVKRHFIGVNLSKSNIIATFQRIRRLRQICEEEKIDALISLMGMNEYGVIATIGLKTKNIFSIRNAVDHLYPNVLKRFFSIRFLSFSDGAVFQTEEAQNWFPKRLRKHSVIIFNPVWSQFYEVDRNPEEGLLVAIGRLHRQKNYPMMFKAMASVAKKHDVRLEVYGKGDDKEKLESLVNELGLSNKVKFLGQCDNIPAVLSRATIYLLASDYEGLPNALMEAMAVGVPCVATDCLGGGSHYLIGKNERGLLVPCNNAELFADAVSKLLDDQTLRNKVSTNACDYAKQFSIDCCFDTWESYINKIINK